jgi:hypothetical protein
VLAPDLAYANLAGPLGRRSVNGYEPLAPQRTLDALGGMRPGGLLRRGFFGTPAELLEGFGVRWVQVPAFALAQPEGTPWVVDREVGPGGRRLFPFPIAPATEVRVTASLPGAANVPAGTAVATVQVRLAATGRELSFPLRAGGQANRRDVVRLALPGRYYVDGVAVEGLDGMPAVRLAGVAIGDAFDGRSLEASNASAYVSDAGRFREAAITPSIRLFEVPAGDLRARVVRRARVLPDDAAVLRTLRGEDAPVDPRVEAVFAAGDVRGVSFPADAQASVANVFRGEPGRIEVRAEGPGVLVIAESWDRGWSAATDGREGRLLRVNHAQMALVVGPGLHRVVLRYRVPGLVQGTVLAGLTLAALGALVLRERRVPRAPARG